tara:strand:+ start:1280 stop:2776 length:1497 start_codon:yes stop_codon:yes gene_type:complete
MSNLSELLPTGGGQNAVDFVASGTLSSGVTVALKSDGTVGNIETESVLQSQGVTQYIEQNPRVMSSSYDSVAGKTVITFSAYVFDFPSPQPDLGKAVVVTTTGNSVSVGSAVEFSGGNNITNFIPTATVYDSNSGKIVIFYAESNSDSTLNTPKAVVGTVSGTLISFGTPVTVDTTNAVHYLSAVYDSINNKVVVFYRDALSSSRGEARVGTVSGNSISFGGAVVFNSVTTSYINSAFDPDTGKIVVSYRQSNGYGESIVGTVSGTSISFGTSVVFNSGTTSFMRSSYDSANKKIVIAYQKADGTNYGAAIVGTVSGTTISFGTAVNFSTTALFEVVGNSFDVNSGKVVIAYGTTTAYLGKVICGQVSGTSISFPDAVIDLTNSSGGSGTIVYDPSALKSVIGKNANSASNDMGVSIIQPAYTSTNSADFIGITAEAISDTATGPVNVYGGINEAQTGLTIGSDYYVQDDGSLSTTVSAVLAGKAISATTINITDLKL